MPTASQNSTNDRAFALIDLIYEGATGSEDAWRRMVAALSEELGGAAISLVMRAPGQAATFGAYRAGMDDTKADLIHAQVKAGLPFYDGADTAELRSRFVRVSDHYPDEELVQTPFYLDYMKPNGLAPEGPIVHLISPQGGSLASGVLIARKEGGPVIEDRQLGLLDLLVPHLARALGIYANVHGRKQTAVALNEVIDRMPIGVILLDRDRQPVLMNRLAKDVVDDEDGFRITEEGPRMADKNACTRFAEFFENCAGPEIGHEMEAGGTLVAERPSGKRPYPIMVLPLIQMLPESTRRDPVCVVFISDPEWRRSSTTEVLKTIYRLTRAEAELVQLLMHGKSLEESANERGVTMNTARSQLKQVFAKTDTSRQGELLRLLMSGVGAIRDDSPSREASTG